jgi:anti-sigma factor RsiW
MGAVHSAECERARLQVSIALDRELSEFEGASLRAHVAGCAACAAFAHELAALTTELRAAPPVPLSASADSLTWLPGVEAPHPRRRRTHAVRVLQLTAAAAAVAFAAGLGSLAGSLSTHRTTTVTTARTGGGNRGAVLDRGIVAMAPGDSLPSSRIRPSVPV